MEWKEKYLQRTFELAALGGGAVRSNPMVGAVLVVDDRIISEGYHQEYGGPHAEVNCLQYILDPQILKKATLYISLEPCTYTGKTPPCIELIIEKKIKQVIIGSTDINPKVSGKGIAYLKSQGVSVLNANWQEIQAKVNIRFIINQDKRRPYFISKIAQSHDGFIGKVNTKTKITSKDLDLWSHKLRSEVDAIIVGKNTWLNDRPALTTRLYPGSQPDIIILAHELKEPIQSRIDQKTVILNQEKEGRENNVIWIRIDINSGKAIAEVLFELGYRNILIEGGSKIIEFFDQADLLDEYITIQNRNLQLKNGIRQPLVNLENFTKQSSETIHYQEKNIYRRKPR